MPVASLLRKGLRFAKYHAERQSERLRYGGLYRGTDDTNIAVHLAEALDWLMRAQDVGTDRGISYGVPFGQDFLGSYPETTGYIIPTFLALSTQNRSLAARAVEAGDWEIQVQLPSGAVMGGIYSSQNPTPALFNTGMVLLGWSALYRETGQPRFLEAARRAAEWMISVQEPDGNWVKGNSEFANRAATVYNVKAAWGLCAAGAAGVGSRAQEAAVRNAEYCLRQQLHNGWFDNCCLDDPSQPLLHTIAYAMQGLIGIGEITARSDFIEAAARCADALVNVMDDRGFLPGRLDASYKGTVSWCCLTGSAQTSLVWSHLHRLTRKAVYRDAAHLANLYLMRHHDIRNPDLRLRGGVSGSWPTSGDYGRFRILNWATNFFVEALWAEQTEMLARRQV
jgi:hypothetical protein